ncbi:Spy/CpxP family protein refolding chaperone [Sulfurimonas sp. C5]|uniref:Spy/CpxP family protein refolding chaperone n=1 Tax=Sulfurimonas sp. C5 TaxID=3036947 RepID=UPI002454D442|nr:Spy/CpxP family protein refolding chaperone [Sulfurimonas sp. C5]MDH4944049.1 Spy/CpxP family protein refolding chaperone [Sulfurimonas sp. C5]
MRFLVIFLLIAKIYADDHELHSKHHIYKELSHLDLTKEQQHRVKKILKIYRKELKEYKELEEDIEDKRKDIFLQKSFDLEKINSLNQQLDREAHGIENRFLQKMHFVLTPQQRKKFVHYFDDWEVE